MIRLLSGFTAARQNGTTRGRGRAGRTISRRQLRVSRIESTRRGGCSSWPTSTNLHRPPPTSTDLHHLLDNFRAAADVALRASPGRRRKDTNIYDEKQSHQSEMGSDTNTRNVFTTIVHLPDDVSLARFSFANFTQSKNAVSSRFLL